jgi:hypothetical protein
MAHPGLPIARSGKTRLAVWVGLLGFFLSFACLAIPMYVIRPFRPQDPWQLDAALTVRGLAPWISAVCAIAALAAVARAWRDRMRHWLRCALATLSLLTVVGSVLTHVNVFEMMFHPYPQPEFESAAAAKVDSDDKVLSVTLHGESRAYPIRTMGYHHIVNDTVGDTPIAVTYCTLCHTGLVWSRMVDGQTLHFRLAGINNGNALMRDEETSSIWQQSTGIAIFGPFRGRQLQLVHCDELSFPLWRKEEPRGLVLKPDAQYASEYDDKDWEKHIEKTRTVVDTSKSGIAPHELMLGVTAAGESKAFPVKSILTAKLIQDRIANIPLLLVVGPDHASMRAFKAGPMTFVSTADSALPDNGAIMRDAETGSNWNFQGCAIDGRMAGRCLEPVDSFKDYWFDWMNHHPGTLVFRS